MCKPQKVQLDCREDKCKFYCGSGTCSHKEPQITVGNGQFACWTFKKRKPVYSSRIYI